MTDPVAPLDDLFAQLRVASAPAELEALQNGIWQQWLATGDVGLDKELEAGMRALQAGDYTLAIRHFNELIRQVPDFGEGWNKRATAHYLRGEYRASLADIAETLRREPRHFGALSGKATMLRQLGETQRAMRTLARLAAICPNLPGLREQQHTLREQLENGETGL
ncbi:MAG: tetratricopeptide repeat protein [Hymenobacter sp.]